MGISNWEIISEEPSMIKYAINVAIVIEVGSQDTSV